MINQIKGSLFANVDGSAWPGGFGSLNKENYAYGYPNLTRGGIEAAGASKLQGGRAISRRKIKNIVNLYRMPRGKKVRTMKKRRLMSLYKRKRAVNKRSRKFRGGYHQYGSQIPNTPTFSLANKMLNPMDSALANPPPYQRLPATTNGIDNFNMNTKRGFQFW